MREKDSPLCPCGPLARLRTSSLRSLASLGKNGSGAALAPALYAPLLGRGVRLPQGQSASRFLRPSAASEMERPFRRSLRSLVKRSTRLDPLYDFRPCVDYVRRLASSHAQRSDYQPTRFEYMAWIERTIEDFTNRVSADTLASRMAETAFERPYHNVEIATFPFCFPSTYGKLKEARGPLPRLAPALYDGDDTGPHPGI